MELSLREWGTCTGPGDRRAFLNDVGVATLGARRTRNRKYPSQHIEIHLS
jgi:hypothetical protein